jgi:hypothetical protein
VSTGTRIRGEGADAVNDLTDLMRRVTELLDTQDLSASGRDHPEENDQDHAQRQVLGDEQNDPAAGSPIPFNTFEKLWNAFTFSKRCAAIGTAPLRSSSIS